MQDEDAACEAMVRFDMHEIAGVPLRLTWARMNGKRSHPVMEAALPPPAPLVPPPRPAGATILFKLGSPVCACRATRATAALDALPPAISMVEAAPLSEAVASLRGAAPAWAAQLEPAAGACEQELASFAEVRREMTDAGLGARARLADQTRVLVVPARLFHLAYADCAAVFGDPALAALDSRATETFVAIAYRPPRDAPPALPPADHPERPPMDVVTALEVALQPPDQFLAHFLHALGARASLPAVLAEIYGASGPSVRAALQSAAAATLPAVNSDIVRALLDAAKCPSADEQ